MRLKGDLKGLLRLLDGKNDTALRIEAILALGRMKTPVAVEELIRLFQDLSMGSGMLHLMRLSKLDLML
jgi:HEAT repeat protein